VSLLDSIIDKKSPSDYQGDFIIGFWDFNL